MHQTEKKITIVENLEDEKIHKMTTFELVAGLLDIEFKIRNTLYMANYTLVSPVKMEYYILTGDVRVEFVIYTGSSPNANSLSGKFNYSYLSNKRTCPLIFFKKKVQPTL